MRQTIPLALPRIVCDPAQPPLAERPLIDDEVAGDLEALFKVLANDSRLRLLHALERSDELCVSDLAAAVSMTPQAVSNQLQRLVDRRILAARRQRQQRVGCKNSSVMLRRVRIRESDRRADRVGLPHEGAASRCLR